MTGSITLPREVQTYLEGVRAALADLPVEERDELLADVEVSVLEAAAEAGEPLTDRLGSPDAFARELRSAAGLEGAAAPASRGRPKWADPLLARGRRLTVDPRLQRARELRALWWVARAYVVAAVLAHWIGDGWSLSQPLLPKLGGEGVSVAMLGAIVAGSVLLGMSARGGRAVMVFNACLVVAAVPVAAHAVDARVQPQATTYQSIEMVIQPGLVRDGEPVRNIYPYSRDGRPLYDVLLYDENGQPLNIGSPELEDPDRRLLANASGRSVFNSFPIRYFEPGTTRVAEPAAAPEVEVPEITTPPLRSTSR